MLHQYLQRSGADSTDVVSVDFLFPPELDAVELAHRLLSVNHIVDSLRTQRNSGETEGLAHDRHVSRLVDFGFFFGFPKV